MLRHSLQHVDEDDAQSVIVASEFGQKFICSLPEIPVQNASLVSNANLTVNLISDVIAASFYVQNCIRRVRESLLKSLDKNICLGKSV